jgi:hypothetical protein
MYDPYKELCTQKGKTTVKESYCHHVCNTSFNLSFHKPHTDTYTTCDRLENIIQAHEGQDKVTEALMVKEDHLEQADAARMAKRKAKERAK